MFDQLTRQRVYDLPSFEMALFSMLLAFILSSIIAFTYKKTYRGFYYSGNFFQALVLSSLTSAMIIMAVGNNLAAGFGIIGAIAIIRFRTRLQNPRNIIFMLAALGVGIGSGVYGYSIAIAGTLIFCTVAFLLYWSPYSKTSLHEFELNLDLSKEFLPALTEILERDCHRYYLISIREGKMETPTERLEYRLTLKEDVDHRAFFHDVASVEGVSNVRIDKRENTDRL